MKRNPFAWFAATAVVAATPFIPVSAEAATPVPAGTVMPADVSAPAVVKHVSTDLDGDGTRDSVDLVYLGEDRFTLSAMTTRKQSYSISFYSAFEAADPATAKNVWYGADAIDGRKGSELIVRIFTTSELQGNEVNLAVYTWRSGMLVAETPPTTPEGRMWRINSGDQQMARGYRFFTSHGHRYVDASRMTSSTLPGVRWKGRVTRSVWRHSAWVKLWTHHAKTTRSLAWAQTAIAGPRLLLDQLDVDISGDGRADRVLTYRTGTRTYLATVSANGRLASAEVAYYSDPFVGAAEVDGVAGRELLARTIGGGDAPEWKVLGWRNGALVAVPGPFANRWHDPLDSDEDQLNFALSVEAGSHYVVAGRTEIYPKAGNPVHFSQFVWDKDHWTKQAEWDAVLTADQASALHAGFTAPDLISP